MQTSVDEAECGKAKATLLCFHLASCILFYGLHVCLFVKSSHNALFVPRTQLLARGEASQACSVRRVMITS